MSALENVELKNRALESWFIFKMTGDISDAMMFLSDMRELDKTKEDFEME